MEQIAVLALLLAAVLALLARAAALPEGSAASQARLDLCGALAVQRGLQRRGRARRRVEPAACAPGARLHGSTSFVRLRAGRRCGLASLGAGLPHGPPSVAAARILRRRLPDSADGTGLPP